VETPLDDARVPLDNNASARSLLAPLIDEYRLYFRPYVLGGGKPYFVGARPPLRLVATDRIGDDVVRLTYVPA